MYMGSCSFVGAPRGGCHQEWPAIIAGSLSCALVMLTILAAQSQITATLFGGAVVPGGQARTSV